jgi:hypothetical protein
MPIVDPDDYEEPAAPAQVQIAAPTFRSVTVDNVVTPVPQLLTAIEGMPWKVRYFSRVLGADDSVGGQGPSTPSVQQQYREIRNLELRVQQDLTPSQDPQTQAMTYAGASVMYPFIVPNTGDMFVADLNDGRQGIFQLTLTTKKSIYRQACHEIEYKMIDFVHTVDDVRLADLLGKVIKSFEFVRDFIAYGQNPLVFEDDFEHLQYLRRNYRTILDTYLRSFYSREYDTILVPGQPFVTYDPYLTKAVLSFFETTDGATMYRARELNIDDDQAARATQLWSALLNRDARLMSEAFTQVGLVSAMSYANEPRFDGIAFSGVQYVVYPVDAMLTVDYNTLPTPKLVGGQAIVMGPQNLSMAQYLLEHPPIIADDLTPDEEEEEPTPDPEPEPDPQDPPVEDLSLIHI